MTQSLWRCGMMVMADKGRDGDGGGQAWQWRYGTPGT